MKKISLIFIFLIIIILAGAYLFFLQRKNKTEVSKNNSQSTSAAITPSPLDALKISEMRKMQYPGSDIAIEETLSPGDNYSQYIVSYKSDGLKIYGLLTVPTETKPIGGFPVIIFNHGYISPKTYQTAPSVGQYASYLPVIARSGYIVFKPDYRGNGNSEGTPETSYYSPDYTIDDLNAISSIKKFPDANPDKIGIWGHSMGGNITLRTLVVDPKDIKAAVIWGGVVGPYTDLIYNWHRRTTPPPEIQAHVSRLRQIVASVGDPNKNPQLWNSIDPTKFVADISAPIQLHHGLSDTEVPFVFSEELKKLLEENKKTVELYEYPGADHNISQDFSEAMQRSVEFFDKYLK